MFHRVIAAVGAYFGTTIMIKFQICPDVFLWHVLSFAFLYVLFGKALK